MMGSMAESDRSSNKINFLYLLSPFHRRLIKVLFVMVETLACTFRLCNMFSTIARCKIYCNFESICFNLSCTNDFFLLVCYNKLGMVHCIIQGVTGYNSRSAVAQW